MNAQMLPTPPPGGWTLSTFPEDAPKRAELLEGRLAWSAQTSWHMTVVRELCKALESQVPGEYAVLHRMAIKLSERTAPEPDISIMHAGAWDLDKSVLDPDDVVLAAEVTTPESARRDREDKPLIYAAMGIQAFWLIERGLDDAPIVQEHELYGGTYRLKHTHISRLKTGVPFPIDIPLEAPKP